MNMWYYIIGGIVLAIFGFGIRIVRPTHRGVVERFGKYIRFAQPGFNWIIPVIDNLIQVNITEQMVDAAKQEIITKDRLNATVDAQVYFKVVHTEEGVTNSQYNVDDYKHQIVNLCRTTLRNIIGNLPYEQANSDRNAINDKLQEVLTKEAKPWGIQIVRTELKEIDPPQGVQDSMNMVIKAENEKQAAVDMAHATETKADGVKRANIKEAEGIAKGKIIVADANAYKIRIEAQAAHKFFVGNAQKLKKLEVTQASLEKNAKIILTEKGISPQLLVGKLPLEQ